MAISVETVKIGVGLAGKIIADKGVEIVVKSATEGLEGRGQKIAVWVGKTVVGKIAGDYVYKEVTGRDFNKDANDFINAQLQKVKSKMKESKKDEEVTVEMA